MLVVGEVLAVKTRLLETPKQDEDVIAKGRNAENPVIKQNRLDQKTSLESCFLTRLVAPS